MDAKTGEEEEEVGKGATLAKEATKPVFTTLWVPCGSIPKNEANVHTDGRTEPAMCPDNDPKSLCSCFLAIQNRLMLMTS